MISVVTPVHNDIVGLVRLAECLDQCEECAQFIIVDDASTDGCADVVGDLADPVHYDIVYRRVDQNHGAGHARNIGMALADQPFTLFMDSDDLVEPATLDGVAQAMADGADFALYQYARRAIGNHTDAGMIERDEDIWDEESLGLEGVTVDTDQVLGFASTVAYPWNKIYRTGFVRDAGLRCSETPVHNDVLLHWMSFTHAKRVILAPEVLTYHFVSPAGTRLTNRAGDARLCLPSIFVEVGDTLTGRPHERRLFLQFARFVDDLVPWARDRLDDSVRDQFDTDLAAALTAVLAPPRWEWINEVSPHLLDRLFRRAQPVDVALTGTR